MRKYVCDKCGVYMRDFVGFYEICVKRVGYSVGGVEELEWRIKERRYCSRCASDLGISKSGLLLVSDVFYTGKVRDESDWGEESYDVVKEMEVK